MEKAGWKRLAGPEKRCIRQPDCKPSTRASGAVLSGAPTAAYKTNSAPSELAMRPPSLPNQALGTIKLTSFTVRQMIRVGGGEPDWRQDAGLNPRPGSGSLCSEFPPLQTEQVNSGAFYGLKD